MLQDRQAFIFLGLLIQSLPGSFGKADARRREPPLNGIRHHRGETRVSGVAQDNAADTLRLGVGAGIRLWKGAQLMLNYDQVIIKPDNQPDGRSVRLSLAQVW